MALPTRMLTDVSADGAGPILNLQNEGRWSYGLVQVDMGGGTGNIAIQGRTGPTMPWFTIVTITADDAQRVSLFPQMRANATSLVAASVTADLVQ